MKLLLLTMEFPPQFGGVAEYYGRLVEHWPNREEAIVVLQPADALAKKRFFKWPFIHRALNRAIREKNIDLILVGQILPLGMSAYLYFLLNRLPYAVFLHGLDFSLARRNVWKRFLSKLILRSAAAIICTNNFTAQAVKDAGLGSESKVFVVHPAALLNWEASPGFSAADLPFSRPEKKVLLSIGRLVPRKGFDRVLSALPLVFKQAPDLLYILIGAGPDQFRLEKIRSRLPADCQEKIYFRGAVSTAEKNYWLKNSDIFIMPSREEKVLGIKDFEGFGIVYLEANLAGLPVIGVQSGGVGEAIKSGESGLLLPDDRPETIARAILDLYHSPEKRALFGRQGRERARNDFNWPGQAVKLKLILEKIFAAHQTIGCK